MFSPSDEPTEVIQVFKNYQSRLRSISSSNRTSFTSDPIQQRLRFEDSDVFKSPTVDDHLTRTLKRSLSQSSTGLSSRFLSSRRDIEVLETSALGPSPAKRFFKNEEVEGLKSELEATRSKLYLKEAEVAETKASSLKLQKLVEDLQMNLKTENHYFESKLIQYRRELATLRSSKDNAESQLEVLKKKFKASQDVERHEKLNENKRHQELEKRVSELILENNEANCENAKLKHELGVMKAKEEERFASLNSQLSIAQSKIEELSDRIKLADQQALCHSEERSQIGKLFSEKQCLELQLQQTREELLLKTGNETQRMEKIDQLLKFSKLEDEIESLRRQNTLLVQTADNTNLLEQKLKSTEDALTKAEEKVSLGDKAILNLAVNQHQLSQWQTAAQILLSNEEQENLGSFPVNVDLFVQKLNSIQKAHIVQLHELNETKLKLKDEAAKIRERDEKLNSLNDAILSEKLLKGKEAENVKKLGRKLALVVQERDSYKKILDSYEHELTITGSQFDEDRLGVLRDLNTRQQATIEELEKKVSSYCQLQGEYERLKLSEVKLEKVTFERDELEFELKRREMKGDFNPLNTKVLHLRDNPAAQAQEELNVTIEKLQRENQSLKARIKLLEEGVTKDLTILVGDKVSETVPCKILDDLQEQLRSSEIRRQRIIEVFKKTSQDFREAVTRLTGYRVDSNSNQDVYKLYPIYYENPGDVLMFKKDGEGEMHLMESDLLATKEDLINLHLKRQHSVPVFLAALLMDLFSKQTFEAVETFVETVQFEDTLFNEDVLDSKKEHVEENKNIENNDRQLEKGSQDTYKSAEVGEEDPVSVEEVAMEGEEIEGEADYEEADEELEYEEGEEEQEFVDGEEEAEYEEEEETQSDESDTESEGNGRQVFEESDDDVIIIDD